MKRKKENFWWNPGSEQDLYHDKNAGTWKQEIVKEDRMNVGIPTEKNKNTTKNRRSGLNTKTHKKDRTKKTKTGILMIDCMCM